MFGFGKKKKADEGEFVFDEEGEETAFNEADDPAPSLMKGGGGGSRFALSRQTIGLIVLLLILAGGGGYYYFFMMEPPPPPPAPTPQRKAVAIAPKPAAQPVAPAPAAPAAQGGATPAGAKPQPTAQPAAQPAPQPVTVAAKTAPASPAPTPVAAKPQAPPTPQPAAAKVTVPPPAPKVAVAPAPKTVPAAAPVESPPAKTVKKAKTVKAQAAESGAYTLSAGVFFDASELREAVRKAERLGYRTQTREVRRETPMTRLLVGYYPPEEAEAKRREYLRSHPGFFTIKRGEQVALYAGSYRNLDKARAYAETLRKEGFKVAEERVSVSIPAKELLFGSFSNQSSAAIGSERAAEAGLTTEIVQRRQG